MSKIRITLAIILIIVFGYIVCGEIFMPANTPVNGNICDILPGDKWVEVKDDGTRVPFTVPGKTDSDIVLETTLPEKFDKDYAVLCFRGMDMEIYVNDELRGVYKVDDYRLLGDRSAECYVMTSVYPCSLNISLSFSSTYLTDVQSPSTRSQVPSGDIRSYVLINSVLRFCIL